MLGIQSIPVRFPIAKVMKQMVGDQTQEEYCEDSMNLSMNFNIEELPTSVKFQNMGNCVACGNCLAGCPYNAKNSTDKNYLLSAIQAGCIVKTECQVQYVVKNLYDIFQERKVGRKRRWYVYLNEVDCILSDFCDPLSWSFWHH
ncbi:hypothetical protein SLA2020_353210 [Shorea laevis]